MSRKKPKINDKAICHGHINYYGEFIVKKVLKEKRNICGYLCQGEYLDYRTRVITEQERRVFWSKKDNAFRV